MESRVHKQDNMTGLHVQIACTWHKRCEYVGWRNWRDRGAGSRRRLESRMITGPLTAACGAACHMEQRITDITNSLKSFK